MANNTISQNLKRGSVVFIDNQNTITRPKYRWWRIYLNLTPVYCTNCLYILAFMNPQDVKSLRRGRMQVCSFDLVSHGGFEQNYTQSMGATTGSTFLIPCCLCSRHTNQRNLKLLIVQHFPISLFDTLWTSN